MSLTWATRPNAELLTTITFFMAAQFVKSIIINMLEIVARNKQ